MMYEDRLGYIEVSNICLESFWFNNKLFIPLECESKYDSDVKVYLCYCKFFDVAIKGTVVPTYDVVFNQGVDGVISVSRVEKKMDVKRVFTKNGM